MTLNNFEITLILYDAESDEIFLHRLPLNKISIAFHETDGIEKLEGSFKIENSAENTHLLGLL